MKRTIQFAAIVALAVLATVAGAFGVGVPDTFAMLPDALAPALALGVAANFPTIEQFKAYMATKTGELEVIRQSLYDTLIYPTAGALNLQFFQNPIGSGASASTGNAGNTKHLADTNMQLPGQLPAPQGFWVDTIEVNVLPGSSAANATTFVNQDPVGFAAAAAATVQGGEHDVSAILQTGALTLTIGQKNYVQEANLMRFPPQARMEYDWALATTSGTVGQVVKGAMYAVGRPYVIEPGIAIATGQNFNVVLSWPVVVATPSGLNAKIQVTLDGWLFRGVQ